ncbi:MAG: hypothetical protein NC489_18445 [Ruminococcus flavefaciens]|nr:hypothetical protein [Ruminococcus flavefaciens]
MNNTTVQKETAIQEEQQLKPMKEIDEIVDEIIALLLSYQGMSVYEGKLILREAMDTLCRMPIIICK